MESILKIISKDGKGILDAIIAFIVFLGYLVLLFVGIPIMLLICFIPLIYAYLLVPYKPQKM